MFTDFGKYFITSRLDLKKCNKTVFMKIQWTLYKLKLHVEIFIRIIKLYVKNYIFIL